MTRSLGTGLGMAHKFVLTSGGVSLGAWSKVSGLSVKWDLAEHRIGNSDQYIKYAGIPKFDKLKLSRAADQTGTTQVKTWLEGVQKSGGTPQQGSMKMLSPAGRPIFSWTLKDLFPVTWSISEFDASASKVLIETLEIVYGGFFTTALKYG